MIQIVHFITKVPGAVSASVMRTTWCDGHQEPTWCNGHQEPAWCDGHQEPSRNHEHELDAAKQKKAKAATDNVRGMNQEEAKAAERREKKHAIQQNKAAHGMRGRQQTREGQGR